MPAAGSPAVGLRAWRPLLTGLRAGTIAFAWALVALNRAAVDVPVALGATGLLVLVMVSLPSVGPRWEVRISIGIEPVVALVAVLATGGWGSPFVLYLLVPLLAVSLAGGPAALLVLAGYAIVLTGAEVAMPNDVDLVTVTLALVLLVAAPAVGLALRRPPPREEADDDVSVPLGRVEQLTHVNALLTALHDLVRTTPAPLTVEDVLRVIRPELDDLFDADAVVLLLAGEEGRWWRPITAGGAAVGQQIARSDLPADVLADTSGQPVAIPRLGEDTGVTGGARSGVYLWLVSRGQRAALLVVESDRVREYPAESLELLERLAAPLGLAIDNALWFQRLRTLGAEEERQRIGAALHDRFAQSLAYVSMELERMVPRYPDDAALGQLRDDVRTTLADLRETLRELRLRCTDERGLVDTLADHVERFGDQYGLVIEFDHHGRERPPLAVENQLLRITQDLLQLAQREAAATVISVSLVTEPGRMRLVVRDDGRGAPEENLGHEASRILALVRDRADAVGGLVDVVARPGEGTEVAVTVRRLP
jgi:signal transduction histidine kinase